MELLENLQLRGISNEEIELQIVKEYLLEEEGILIDEIHEIEELKAPSHQRNILTRVIEDRRVQMENFRKRIMERIKEIQKINPNDMGIQLDEKAYRKLINGDIMELKKHMPKHSLEKKHIVEVLKWSIRKIYETTKRKRRNPWKSVKYIMPDQPGEYIGWDTDKKDSVMTECYQGIIAGEHTDGGMVGLKFWEGISHWKYKPDQPNKQ